MLLASGLAVWISSRTPAAACSGPDNWLILKSRFFRHLQRSGSDELLFLFPSWAVPEGQDPSHGNTSIPDHDLLSVLHILEIATQLVLEFPYVYGFHS